MCMLAKRENARSISVKCLRAQICVITLGREDYIIIISFEFELLKIIILMSFNFFFNDITTKRKKAFFLAILIVSRKTQHVVSIQF